MVELAHQYLDFIDFGVDGAGQVVSYSDGQAGAVWQVGDLFVSMAGEIRTKTDHDSLPPGGRVVPCCMWLVRFDGEPSAPKIRSLYEEAMADPRRADYYHLITVHEDCPVEEECLQRVLGSLRFELKPDDTYADLTRFRDTTRGMLACYHSIMAAPWHKVGRVFDSVFAETFSTGL